MCINCLSALCDSDERTSHFLWLPETGGRFLFPTQDVHASIENHNFQHGKGKRQCVFAIFTGSEE